MVAKGVDPEPKSQAAPEPTFKEIAERYEITKLLDDIAEANGTGMAKLTLAIVRRVMSWHATRDSRFVSLWSPASAPGRPLEPQEAASGQSSPHSTISNASQPRAARPTPQKRATYTIISIFPGSDSALVAKRQVANY